MIVTGNPVLAILFYWNTRASLDLRLYKFSVPDVYCRG